MENKTSYRYMDFDLSCVERYTVSATLEQRGPILYALPRVDIIKFDARRQLSHWLMAPHINMRQLVFTRTQNQIVR